MRVKREPWEKPGPAHYEEVFFEVIVPGIVAAMIFIGGYALARLSCVCQ